MIRLTFFVCFLFLGLSCQSQPNKMPHAPIVTGAEQIGTYLPLLSNKKIALVVNQTSVVGKSHLVDTLLSINQAQSLHIQIEKVFAPEHGFRGNAEAGAVIKNGVDINTGLPILSLHGKHKKPTSEQLEGLDAVIFDIQDVGARFYTYISTMHYVMEACAENNIEFIVLDRPNPIGMYVDGPVLDTAQQSFVGMHRIPIVHGLTVGELAQMIKGENWINSSKELSLKVIKVKNYDHRMTYSLPIKPSPNLPNDLSIALYPSLCLFEGTDISVGRGTYAPFLQIGHPTFDSTLHSFTPISIDGMSKHPKHQDKTCYGIDFSEKPIKYRLELGYLIDYYNRYEPKDKFFNDYFKKLAGTDQLEEQIRSGVSEDEIRASWQEELDRYKKMRKKYLLYKDFE